MTSHLLKLLYEVIHLICVYLAQEVSTHGPPPPVFSPWHLLEGRLNLASYETELPLEEVRDWKTIGRVLP
jgi:hypothetical protein